jgi:hypothetical protein
MNEEQLKKMIDECFSAPEEQKASFLNDLATMLDSHAITPRSEAKTLANLSLEQQIILEILKRQNFEGYRTDPPIAMFNYARELARLILANQSE